VKERLGFDSHSLATGYAATEENQAHWEFGIVRASPFSSPAVPHCAAATTTCLRSFTCDLRSLITALPPARDVGACSLELLWPALRSALDKGGNLEFGAWSFRHVSHPCHPFVVELPYLS
jgi:hypothetical protein